MKKKKAVLIVVAILATMVLVISSPFLDPSRLHISGMDHTLNDQVEYVTTAENIVKNGKFESSVIQTGTLLNGSYHHMPGYPLLLALFYKLFGISPVVSLLPSLLAFIFSVILVYLIGEKLFNFRVGCFASLMMACFVPLVIYSFTSMAEMSFIFAGLFIFWTATVLPPNLRPYAIPFLLIIPFLFRETGAILVIPLAVLAQFGVEKKSRNFFGITVFGSIFVLAITYRFLISSGSSQMFLKNLMESSFDDKYRNAFLSSPDLTANSLAMALRSHLATELSLLGDGLGHAFSSFQFFSFLFIFFLIILSFAFAFADWKGKKFSLAAALLGSFTLLLILLLYRVDGLVGMRMLLFSYPFLILSCAAFLVTYSGLRKTRIVLTGLCSIFFLVNLHFFPKVSKAVIQNDPLDDQNTHFLETLQHDDSRVLLAPVFLSMDYVWKHFPVKWAFEPSNIKTWELLENKVDVGTLVVREDGLDKDLATILLNDKKIPRQSQLEYRGVKIRVFQR